MMGARNVAACFALWADLPPTPFRLLVGMALMALDEQSKGGRPPRVWFGGEDALLEYSGCLRRGAYRALQVLVDAGAVESVDAGRHGHRATYRLNLLAITGSESTGPAPVDGADAKGGGARSKGAQIDTRKGAQIDTEGCTDMHLKGARERTPRNHEGFKRKSRRGEEITKATTSPGLGDNFANRDDDRGGSQVPSLADIERHLAAFAS